MLLCIGRRRKPTSPTLKCLYHDMTQGSARNVVMRQNTCYEAEHRCMGSSVHGSSSRQWRFAGWRDDAEGSGLARLEWTHQAESMVGTHSICDA